MEFVQKKGSKVGHLSIKLFQSTQLSIKNNVEN